MLKRTVILSLIGFTIIFSAGIALIFKSSNDRDAEHIGLVSLAGKVENEILNTRILIDDILLTNDDSLIPDFRRSIDSVREGLDQLYSTFTEGSKKNDRLDIGPARENYTFLIDQLEVIDTRINASGSLAASDTTLFYAVNGIIRNYRNLQAFLPAYLIRDNIQYKREIIIVLVINFLIILLAGFIIVKLIDQLIRADRALVIKTIDVENRERERIAADLHDGLGSLLSGLIIHLRVLEKQNREQP